MDGHSLLAVVPAVTVALDICPRTPKAIVRNPLEKSTPSAIGRDYPFWPILWDGRTGYAWLAWV